MYAIHRVLTLASIQGQVDAIDRVLPPHTDTGLGGRDQSRPYRNPDHFVDVHQAHARYPHVFILVKGC